MRAVATIGARRASLSSSTMATVATTSSFNASRNPRSCCLLVCARRSANHRKQTRVVASLQTLFCADDNDLSMFDGSLSTLEANRVVRACERRHDHRCCCARMADGLLLPPPSRSTLALAPSWATRLSPRLEKADRPTSATSLGNVAACCSVRALRLRSS